MAERKRASLTQAAKRNLTYRRREATGKYWIDEVKQKDRTVYHVICPDGWVANEHDHTDLAVAEAHRDMLDLFYGRRRDEV